ncbi:MAG: radical SAM protein [Bacteroidota bacterium]|nr:radical SAM protein [Bacteroidota bacterium]
MKVLLINPPRSPENSILKYAPEEARRFIHKKLIGPPLGLLTIAAAVKDHDVIVFDSKGEYDLNPETPALPDLVKRLVEKNQPDIVGVTVITSEFLFAIEILRQVKKSNPRILTIAGGLHTTLCPDDFTDPAIDVVIPGQSAFIFRDVVNAREKDLPLESVPGILLNTPAGLKKTDGKPKPVDPADKGFLTPDRNHLKRWISTYKVGNNPFPSTYLFTSLGCPYKCTFCSIWTQFRGKYYQRTIDSLIEELKSVDDYPVVRFADANSVVHIKFIESLFDRIHAEGIKKTFVMDIRADVAAHHPDVIEKMARGGLKVVICGFESYRDEELKKYNKNSPAVDNTEAIRVFEQNGIMVRGNYVIPPDYDESDFENLSGYADRNRVVYAGYTVLTPIPGTVFYKQVKDRIIDHDYRKYNFFNSVMMTKLPFEEFHNRIGKLWLIKKGEDVI